MIWIIQLKSRRLKVKTKNKNVIYNQNIFDLLTLPCLPTFALKHTLVYYNRNTRITAEFLHNSLLFVSILIFFIIELVTHCPMPCITNAPCMNPVVQFVHHIIDSLQNEERMAADSDDSSKEMAERRPTVLTQRRRGRSGGLAWESGLAAEKNHLWRSCDTWRRSLDNFTES